LQQTLAQESAPVPAFAARIDMATVFKPASGIAFSLLDDRPILFSEVNQKLYELNQTAAYIWCSLLDGKQADEIVLDLQHLGQSAATARTFVRDALRNWLNLGLVEAIWPFGGKHQAMVRVGEWDFAIRTSNDQLLQQLLSIFVEASSPCEEANDIFDVVKDENQAYVFQNEKCVLRIPVDELIPAFKAQLTARIIERNSPSVAFHAACLYWRGRGLLVSGPPGAGKSILTFFLSGAGFAYASDDVTLIAPDGEASGIPFAVTLKSGAWPIVESAYPGLREVPVHKRSDGKLIRYATPSGQIQQGSFPVGWILFIERVPGSITRLEPLGQIETMERWINSTYAVDGRLSNQAFHSLKETLTKARSFKLFYENATEARDMILALCNDQL
jgi:hypothetical protein